MMLGLSIKNEKSMFSGRYVREMIALGFGAIITGFYYFLVEYQPHLSIFDSVSKDQLLGYHNDAITIVLFCSILITTVFVGIARKVYDIQGGRLLLILLLPSMLHLLIRLDLYTFHVPLTALVVLPSMLVTCVIILPNRLRI